MGYIKYDCEKFHKSNNNLQTKCSIKKLYKVLYDFDQIEEELKVEFIEVKEILEESKREIKALLYLNIQQDKMGKEVSDWINNCQDACETNMEECKCRDSKAEYSEEIEDVEEVINQALHLIEETMEKITVAKELINKKSSAVESIKNNCCLELCEDYRYCYDEYEE